MQRIERPDLVEPGAAHAHAIGKAAQELDGDERARSTVARTIDHTHPTATGDLQELETMGHELPDGGHAGGACIAYAMAEEPAGHAEVEA